MCHTVSLQLFAGSKIEKTQGRPVLTATCFLAVYMLLQTFDHNIRIEIRSNISPTNGGRNQETGNGVNGQLSSSHFETRPQQVTDVACRIFERELILLSRAPSRE